VSRGRAGRLVLVILLAGCSRRSSPDSANAVPTSASDAATPLATSEASSDQGSPPEAGPIEAGPAPAGEAGPSREAREQAVRALLAGGEPATRLPSVVLDPGLSFDPNLRDRVAPRIVVERGGSGGSGLRLRMEPPTVTGGGVPPEVVERIVRQNFGRYRLCYENGLRDNPKLEGKVAIQFVIGKDGTVDSAKVGSSTLANDAVLQCVRRGFMNLSFPEPEHGTATVTCPLVFSLSSD
jgi:TonB family protein